jgi:hypothetical protein
MLSPGMFGSPSLWKRWLETSPREAEAACVLHAACPVLVFRDGNEERGPAG